MKLAWCLGLAGAVILHLAFLLFGGLLFPKARKDAGTMQEVELLSEVEAETEEKPEELEPEEAEELEPESEQPPDSVDLVRAIDLSSVDDTPALEAASLSAIEAALNQSGAVGGDFNEALSFASGGSIGATGSRSEAEDMLESAFSLAEIDQ